MTAELTNELRELDRYIREFRESTIIDGQLSDEFAEKLRRFELIVERIILTY